MNTSSPEKSKATYALSRLIGRITRKNQIIQFGIPRSGSTLVFNVLREIFPDKRLKKTHSLSSKDLKYPIIASYRHPLDVMASLLQCQNLKVNDAEIKKQLFLLYKNGILDILEFKDRPNVLLLRYERFSNDFDYLFSEIEKFFEIQIPGQLRASLQSTYNIHNVKTSINSDLDFSYHDKKTLLHGRHISKFEGKVYYYKEFFSHNQIDYLAKNLAFFMDEMGYEINKN
jgi:hypothetical protein